jgi:hypothetical protein
MLHQPEDGVQGARPGLAWAEGCRGPIEPGYACCDIFAGLPEDAVFPHPNRHPPFPKAVFAAAHGTRATTTPQIRAGFGDLVSQRRE